MPALVNMIQIWDLDKGAHPWPPPSKTHPGYVQFTHCFDDDHGHIDALKMNGTDWVHMGSPERITVTIEPFDQPNG
ncbi:MAG: hypothetical protein AAGA99_00490 [Actinomycetota bacterium]